MMTEREKMTAGLPYDPHDAELHAGRIRAARLTRLLRECDEDDEHARRRIFGELVAAGGSSALVRPPFYCDYGYNITLGENVFFNFNCVVLDVCPVTIGSNTLFGPAVQIYTPLHPMSAQERRDYEFGKAVSIGSDVWVGGGAIILPGVHVGSRTIVGAGSVVTRDVPEGVFAAGNPCRVIREVES